MRHLRLIAHGSFVVPPQHYQLVDEKELAPLQELIEHITGRIARQLGVSTSPQQTLTAQGGAADV